MSDEPNYDPHAAHGGDPAYQQAAEAWEAHPEAGEQPPPPEPEPRRRARIWPRVVGVLLLFVVVGGVWIWQNPGFVQSRLRPWFPGPGGGSSEAQQIKALEVRVAQLEQRPQPNLAPLTQRLDALEARAGSAAPQPSADLQALTTRVDTLEAQVAALKSQPAAAPEAATAGQIAPPPELSALSARLDALQRRQAQQSAEAARIDALAEQINSLSAHSSADLSGKLDGVEHRLNELAASQTQLAGTADRVLRLSQVQLALAAGRPLGTIPNAPPALVRFATTPPPTEAGLRLAFVADSQQALKVSSPDTEGKPFFDRVLARLQDSRLVTVREGDRVVVGSSTGAILTHAQSLLDAGDLRGSIAAVKSLSGPPAEKMAPWLADAEALQSAREALGSMAGGA